MDAIVVNMSVSFWRGETLFFKMFALSNEEEEHSHVAYVW